MFEEEFLLIRHTNDANKPVPNNKELTNMKLLLRQFDFCLQVATGMRYLHVQKTAHRDLKSLNILITLTSEGDILLKISDFGLSKEDIGVVTAGEK